MVFQDPFASINPVFRVQHGVLRSLKLHRPELSAAQRLEEAARVFEVVGLNADMLQRFPYELSGGQRQRVGFAQALAMRPKLILADEPVSMLDVSIRIGLLNLMAKLRDEEGVSILYITHDIASARYVADRLIVMYAGQIAETGPIEDVLAHPRHPYTQLLLSAVPDPRAPLSVAAETDRGEPPKVIDPVPGCRFRWRCPLAIDTCAQVTPELAELSPDHDAACHVAQTSAEEVKAFSMKLAVIGGGSTYTPELADGIGRLLPQVTEFVLVDPDPSPARGGGAGVGPDHGRPRPSAPGCAGPAAWTRAPTARTRSCSSSGSAARPPASATRPGRWTAAASGRRPPGRAGWPRRSAPYPLSLIWPNGPGDGLRPLPSSSTSPTRWGSSPGPCSPQVTVRSACATWPSGSSAISPPCSASHRTGCPSATSA